MVPRPPVWSSRAALQILDERERRERSKNKRNVPEETLGDSSRRTERRLSDDEFYARFRSDYWSPYECTSIFRRTKYALTVGVGKLFARYTLLVYRHPWTFIIFPAAVCLLLGVGFLFRKVVTDHEKQYALPKSTSHDDAKRYADNFGESQVRSEVIYVTAASGTNLLNTDFLNALWNFHTSVLDLEVTASLGTGAKQNHAAFSMSDGQQLQQQGAESYVRETASPRRLFSSHLPDSKSTSTTPPSSPPAAPSHSSDSVAPPPSFSPSTLSSSAGVADVSSSSASSPCALVFVAAFSPSETSASPSSSLQSTSCGAGASGPFIKSSVAHYLKNETVRERRSRGRPRGLAAAWPQTLGSGRLFGDRMWRGGGILPPGAAAPPVPGGPFLQNFIPFRPMPPAVGGLPPTGPPSLSPPGGASPPGPPRGEDTSTGPPCVEASAHPKDRISGLACRPPVKSGHYAFSNLCWKDAAGICAPPDGVIFMYNSRGEFGNPLGYPRHANWVLATEAPTDIWLSQRGLQLAAGGSQARATAGLALRYLLSDDPAQRPAAIEWEHALMRHINRAGDALPGASLYVKTEQSLAEDLSSSIDPTGHEDIIYVLIAALLIFIYLGFATFSTNRYRSKMLVSLIGGLAAALAYCGGAGLCYLVGLEHTTTVTAAPFLVLGIGVDDVFVIINSYSLTYTRASARERLRITMRDAGVSITVTTLTNLISFAIGSTSPYLAIKNFCVITAAGLFAGYLMCITFFVGCLTIDARYEEKRRLDEVCSCLLPVYRHWHAGNKKTEKSTSASATAASQANASSSHVAVEPGQQPLPDRIAGGEEDSNDSIKQLDGAAHTKQAAPRVLTEVKGKRRLDYMRQSLLNRHANTVYECVTLQVAMALTKGKVDKNASARNATLQSFWGRVKPSQKQVQGRPRDSRSPQKNSQGIVSQPQTSVYHPLSNDPAAVANHSGSLVVRSHMRQVGDHESGKSSETYRTDVTSQDARASSRWNQQRSVAQPRHLTNGFFEGDLVLTHQIPVRTSSNSTPTDDYAERKKRRISNPKDVYSVLRGRLYSRKGQGQITQFVCQENGAATGWGAGGNFCTSISRRPHDEDLEGQLKHRAGRYRSREGHRSRARHNKNCSHASETYRYAQRRDQSDGSDAAPAAEREQHTWKAADGARQLGRGGRRQNGPTLQGIKLSDTYDYESQAHERSTLQAKQKKVCLRGEGPAEAASDEDHDSYEALKPHSYEQTGIRYSPKNRGGGSEERRRFAQAGHVKSRQQKIMSQLPKKAKKTTYKRRRQNPSVRLAAPTRWGRGSVYDSMAHKPRQSDKRERIAGRQGIQAQHGLLMGKRLQRYSPRQHQLSQAPTERGEVAQSRILRPREDQEHLAAKRDNIAERGGVLPLSQKDAGRPVSSLKPTRKTTFNGQRKRRFPLSADSDAASSHEAAEGSRNEGAKNTGTGSRPRGRNLEKAEEQASGGLQENLAKQKQATRGKEETNDFDRAKSQRVTDTPGCKEAGNSAPADASALQREAPSDRRLKDTDIDVRKVQNLRKPSLLQRLGRRQSDNTTGEEGGGATQGHQQNRSAFKVHSKSIKPDNGGGLPATPQSPQARRHELLRILKPEDLAEPPGNVGRLWRLFVLHHLGRIFITPVVKLIVLVGFAAIFAVAVTGCMKLKRGLDLRNLSRDGSSLKKFFDVQANYFSTYGDPVNIFFLKPQQPCSLAFKSEYAWFHNLLESRQYTKLLVDGLDTYLKSPLGGLSPSDNAAACMQMLRSWLQTPVGSNFAWQFTWQNDGELKAFQIQLVPRYYSGSKELSDFMTMLREDLTRFKSASVHAYNKHFIFYESDSNVLASTLSNMAWAVLAVTVVSLVLLPSLWSAAMVIFILILIDVAIMGFMYYWDLPLNMLTMVNLIISIGFSIDYASHMCHTFSHCVGRSRDMRVFETLVLIGNPIFHGVMSTQLGVLVLAYTCSYVLRVFFKMMTLVLTLAFAHGAVLLPVLLSLFGPMGSREEPLNVALSNFREGLTLNRILSKKYSA